MVVPPAQSTAPATTSKMRQPPAVRRCWAFTLIRISGLVHVEIMPAQHGGVSRRPPQPLRLFVTTVRSDSELTVVWPVSSHYANTNSLRNIYLYWGQWETEVARSVRPDRFGDIYNRGEVVLVSRARERYPLHQLQQVFIAVDIWLEYWDLDTDGEQRGGLASLAIRCLCF